MKTLLEASKNITNPLDSAVTEVYAKESPILRVLPFRTIGTLAYKYNREDTLPGVGFRGVNEAFPESTGIIVPMVETLAIAGGDCDVDKVIVDTEGPTARSIETNMKLKALSLSWGAKFFKGDSVQSPAEFDGLQTRVSGNQKIAAGNTAGGNALSLYLLDRAIKQTYRPSAIFMDKTLGLRLTQAARKTTVGGNITWTTDEFGRQIALYNGIPILETEEDNTGISTLGFNEACPGGGAATGASIYILSFGADTLFGIQKGLPEARDLGEIDEKPVLRTRVEWVSGIATKHPRCATRIWGISDAEFVA
jgi:hypothetical protein